MIIPKRVCVYATCIFEDLYAHVEGPSEADFAALGEW